MVVAQLHRLASGQAHHLSAQKVSSCLMTMMSGLTDVSDSRWWLKTIWKQRFNHGTTRQKLLLVDLSWRYQSKFVIYHSKISFSTNRNSLTSLCCSYRTIMNLPIINICWNQNSMIYCSVPTLTLCLSSTDTYTSLSKRECSLMYLQKILQATVCSALLWLNLTKPGLQMHVI